MLLDFARLSQEAGGGGPSQHRPNGLIAAGISIAIIVAVNGLGTNLNNKFTSINTSLK